MKNITSMNEQEYNEPDVADSTSESFKQKINPSIASPKRSRMEVMNELLKLKELLDVGVLNQQEYEELRKKLMTEL